MEVPALRSIVFEIPGTPRAILQRVGGKLRCIIRVEDAIILVAEIEHALQALTRDILDDLPTTDDDS